MYTVKTINWNGNRAVESALNAIAKMTGADYYPEADHDTKYYMQTHSATRAWIAWGLFTALKGLSGGWTYIIRPGNELDNGYKSIY